MILVLVLALMLASRPFHGEIRALMLALESLVKTRLKKIRSIQFSD